jgi:hypothetical protein
VTAYPALAALRTDADARARQVADLARRQAALQQELAATPPTDRIQLLALRRQLAQVGARLAVARPAADTARAAYLAGLDALTGALDPTVPCALLPVRLETRIRPRTDGRTGDELLCRIYPDDIHTDGHDRTLTEAEIALGQHYWRQRWAAEAAGSPDAHTLRVAAWEQLATRFTPSRAAWVARMLTPTNLPPTAAGPPNFPTPATRTGDGQPTFAAGLPDRWLVRLWRDGQRLGEGRGELVPRPLPVAPPPDPDDPAAPTRWLVDVPAALAVGMAVLVRPQPPVDLDRVDLVTATGVRGADDPAEGGETLRDLLDAHQFALGLTGPGLDLLPQGTPTNNTPQVRTPRRRDGTGTATAADRLGDPAATRSDGSDAAVLAAALGLPDRDLDPAGPGERFVFGRLPNAAAVDQRDAAAMATVLWPATWGYYLHQFVPGVAGLGPAADLAGWRRFVVDTVRGRGPLPAVRIGDQPYGVLPALDTAAWQPWPDQPELLVATLHGGPRQPAGAELRVGWDLDRSGGWTGGWTGAGEIPVDPAANGLDLALGDLDGDGRPDAVVVVSTTTGPAAAYRVGVGLDQAGTPARWTDPVEVPVDPDATLLPGAAGVAVADLGGGPALVVALSITEAGGGRAAPEVTAVRVGTGLDAAGGVAGWSAAVAVPDSASAGRLAGAAAADLTGRGEVDLVLAWVRAGAAGDELVYRVGRGLRDTGEVDAWSAPRQVPVPAGWQLLGAGVALAVLTRQAAPDQALDVVVHLASQAGNQPVGSYLVGAGVAVDGTVRGWSGPFNTGELAPARTRVLAAGIAVGPLGRRHQVTTAVTGGLVDLLGQARDSWAGAVPQVPRVGRTADPTDDLLDLFARDAVSGSVRARGLLGSRLLLNAWLAAGMSVDQPRFGRGLWQQTRTLLADWGLIDPAAPDADEPAGKPRLGVSAFEEVATDIPVPLADDRTPAALAAAATAPPAALHRQAFVPGAALLDRLVRHAALQAWADAGLLLRPPDGPVDQAPWVEPELVDLADLTAADPVTPARTPTAWRHLDEQTFPAGHPWQGRRVRDGVAELVKTVESGGDVSGHGAAGRAVVELAELRAVLIELAGRPPETLARLLGETLDVAAHRLDAWVTAVATQRLWALRTDRPDGLHLGGYGILVDLRKRGAGAESQGYLHVPSPAQASTAAVLRSGYLAHAGDPLGGTLALDLTSRRVREATELAGGVRAGQPLAALLGSRFERALLADPARGLGRYLPALRQVAPLVAGKRDPLPAGVPVDAVAATDVVDGLALIRATAPDAGTPIPWGTTPSGAGIALPALTDADGVALAAAIEDLRDAVDAVGDLLVADAVHHAVTGSPAAAGGGLDVLAGAELPPPEPEVVRTPRGGIGVTHRVLLALPEPAAVPELADWAANRPRALAEPQLNGWAAAALGSPGSVRWRAVWPQAGVQQEYPLAALGLCPLDVLALAGTPVAEGAEAPTGRPDARTDGERLLAWHAASNPPAGAAGPLLLDLRPDPGWPDGTLAVPELFEVAAAAADLVTGARAATAADLAGPRGLRPAGDVDLTGATAAATAAVAGLRTAVATLRAATDSDATRTALAALAGYGLPHAAPGSPTGSAAEDIAALAEQAAGVAAEADRRLSTADTASTAGDPVGALRAVFGPGFTVVPPCAAPPDGTGAAGGELAAGLTARAAAGDADDGTVGDWLESLAAVRLGVARLADVRLLAGAAAGAGTSPATALRVAQLPADAGGWAALADPAGAPPPAGVVSLTLAGAAFDPADPVAALLVDDWVEVVPARRQDTAVVFQLDAPSACAPQAVLLAVAADPSRRWTEDTVEQVVLDTVTLAQLRAVDLDLPGTPPSGSPAAGHFLPALLLARNSGGDPFGDTIATDIPRPPAP